jgi:hypothetical protein
MVLGDPGRQALSGSWATGNHVRHRQRLGGELRMATVSNVYDHTGVRIGTATAAGDVYDHNVVRIGRVDGEGDVYDHTGVRIGRVRIEEGLPRPI